MVSGHGLSDMAGLRGVPATTDRCNPIFWERAAALKLKQDLKRIAGGFSTDGRAAGYLNAFRGRASYNASGGGVSGIDLKRRRRILYYIRATSFYRSFIL